MSKSSEKVEVAVSTVADLVRKAEAVQTIEGVPIVILAEGQRHIELDHLMPNPRSIKENVKVVSVDSFVSYWRRYSSASSVIFVDDKAHTVNAAFAYHNYLPAWVRPKIA